MTSAVQAAASKPAHDGHPLTEAQLGIWYAQQLDPANPVFNTGQTVTLRGPLDVDALRRAIATALKEAEALTARFDDSAGEPRQFFAAHDSACLELHDFSRAPDPQAAAQAHMARDSARPRDPRHDPLVTEHLLILGENHHIWYQNLHHLVVDGFGTALLTKRIVALYSFSVTAVPASDSLVANVPFAPAMPWLEDDAAYHASSKREQDRAYWLERFADRPQVAGIAAGEAVSAHRFHRVALTLDHDVSQRVTERAKRIGAGWPDVLTALAAAFIQRQLGGGPDGGDEVIIGVPHMGRFGTPAARVPAMVMNVLPIRLAAEETDLLDDFIGMAVTELGRARRRGRYRSEQLRRDLGLLGQGRRLYGPLVNVLPFDEQLVWPRLEASSAVLGTGPVDDLTFTLRADSAGRGLRLELDANPDLYAFAETKALANRFGHFLKAAASAERLLNVPTLAPDEEAEWRSGFGSTSHAVEDTTLATLLARASAATPEAEALVDGEHRWTYAQLERETLHFAGEMKRQGVRQGDIVAVALPRSRHLVLALLAIVRCGAAYLPLDATHPADRLARILHMAQPRLTITDGTWRGLLPDDSDYLLLDDISPTDDSPLSLAAVAPDDAAYVIYTSGSTGDPKGVVVEHRAIVNRLLWMGAHYGIGPGDRILQKTPVTFDVSVWEFFLPLITGATLHVAPPEAHKDPQALVTLIREQGITTMHFVPSMLALFLSEPEVNGLAIRRVFVSGEELPAALRDRFHSLVRGELHNLYGPTEAAVDVSYWPAGPDDTSVPVPIGWPVWNTRLYVLDRHQRPVPTGVAGELYLAGRQIARGYLGRPDLTAERFLPDPFVPGERMYRTGDLARARADGAIVYLGRTDHQVKLRGLRIELGEIEAAAMASGLLEQVAVVARDDGPDGKRLVLYGVVRTEAEIDSLRAAIASRVPDYMVPSAFVLLPVLPLSANGKLDRKALPAPALTMRAGRSPHEGTEQQVADLFAGYLNIRAESIHADDDFFGLGGHSLLAARLVQGIRDVWGLAFGMGIVFAEPTVARLAARIDAQLRTEENNGNIINRIDGNSAPGNMVSHAPGEKDGLGSLILLNDGDASRAPLFCIHPAGGIAWCYAGLARALAPERRVYGVQARGLHAGQPLPESIDAMAADYIATIRTIVPQGPLHLAGWSVGGLIAHAMAVQLREAGEPAGLLALLDAYPADCWRAEPDVGEDMALKAVVQIAGHELQEFGNAPLTRETLIAFLRRIGNPLGALSDEALTGVVRVVSASNRLVRQHWHRRYPGEITYFRAALDHEGTDLSPAMWAPFSELVSVTAIPSRHAHLTRAAAMGFIAPALRARLSVII